MSNSNGYEKKTAKQDLNLVTMSGNLGKVKDMTYFDSGVAVLNFSVACSDDYYQGEGENRKVIERTTWLECAVYGKHAEGLNNVIRKWKHVTVVGKLQPARGYSSNNTIGASNVLKVEQVFANQWKDKEEQGSVGELTEGMGATVTETDVQF